MNTYRVLANEVHTVNYVVHAESAEEAASIVAAMDGEDGELMEATHDKILAVEES